VRTAISESSFIVDDSLRPLRVTVSIGVAAFNGNRKRFFQKADQALYRAKADGKNCVVVHEDECPRPAASRPRQAGEPARSEPQASGRTVASGRAATSARA
jgi:hypothetical protein